MTLVPPTFLIWMGSNPVKPTVDLLENTVGSIQYRLKGDDLTAELQCQGVADLNGINFITDPFHQTKTIFKPPGQKIHEYFIQDSETKYEYFLCDFSTRNFKKLHDKIQFLLQFFIDGVVEIEEDVRWSMVLVYKHNLNAVTNLEYEFIGYCSYYNFFHYPESTRIRISQFIIFPPWQKQGHGQTLYKFLMDKFRRDPKVVDITVEDPNDSFQDMRDVLDVVQLQSSTLLKQLKPNDITPSIYNTLKQEYKMCMKQLVRALEILMLKNTCVWDARAVKEYRIWVKRRIYNKNKDVLEEMEFGTRLSKLQETFELVEQDYMALLNKI